VTAFVELDAYLAAVIEGFSHANLNVDVVGAVSAQ
jgi:hypothetical protein